MDPLLVRGLPGDGPVDVAPLASAEAGAFAAMTFPIYRSLLDLEPAVVYPADGDERRVRPVAFAARLDGRPAGLALAGVAEDDTASPELLSIFVGSAFRRHGVGRALLEAVQEDLGSRGHRRLGGVYMTSLRGVEALEAFLSRVGWHPPRPRMVVVKFTVDEAKTVRWYRTYRMRDGLELIPWRDVSAAEIGELRTSQAAAPWIPGDLVPWRHDPARLETESSIAARLDGRLVGWVINHRIDDDLVRFTSAFIRDDLARRGRLVPMFSESIRRLDATPYRRCMFTTPVHHREMVAFIKRRCERWVTFVGETRGAWIDLRPPSEPTRGAR